MWRHPQSIVKSSADRKPSEQDTWTLCKDGYFNVIYGFVMSCKNKNNVCILVTNCLCAHSSVILLFIPSLPRNSGNILQNNPLVSAETVCHSSTYIILYWFYYATILTFGVRYNQTPLWHWSWNFNKFEPYLPTLVWHLKIYLAMCPCLLIIAEYVLAKFSIANLPVHSVKISYHFVAVVYHTFT